MIPQGTSEWDMNIIEECRKYMVSRGLRVLRTTFHHASGEDVRTEINIHITATPEEGMESQHIDPDVVLHGICPLTNIHYACQISSMHAEIPPILSKTGVLGEILHPLLISAEFVCFIPEETE